MRKLINLSYCVKMFVCTMILSCALVIAISAIPINSLALAEDIITVELSVTLSGPRPTILPAGDNKRFRKRKKYHLQFSSCCYR